MRLLPLSAFSAAGDLIDKAALLLLLLLLLGTWWCRHDGGFVVRRRSCEPGLEIRSHGRGGTQRFRDIADFTDFMLSLEVSTEMDTALRLRLSCPSEGYLTRMGGTPTCLKWCRMGQSIVVIIDVVLTSF